jgi:hypothetical protein
MRTARICTSFGDALAQLRVDPLAPVFLAQPTGILVRLSWDTGEAPGTIRSEVLEQCQASPRTQ